MNAFIKSKRMVRLVLPVIAAAGVLSSAPRANAQLIYGPEINTATPPGLGDLGNTIIWGMACSRTSSMSAPCATFCVQQATLQFTTRQSSPAQGPAFNCTPRAHDLDAGEIWRFTPATGPGGTRDMVPGAQRRPHQGTPRRSSARDIGYRA
jgi:hypothetical protein